MPKRISTVPRSPAYSREALQFYCKGNDKVHKGGCNVSHLSEMGKDIVKTHFSLVVKGTSLLWGVLNFLTDAGVMKGLCKISRD